MELRHGATCPLVPTRLTLAESRLPNDSYIAATFWFCLHTCRHRRTSSSLLATSAALILRPLPHHADQCDKMPAAQLRPIPFCQIRRPSAYRALRRLAPTERSRTSTWSLLGVSSAARSVCRASAVGVAYDSRRFLFGDSETLHVRRRGPLQAAHLPPATLRSSDNMGATPRALASRRGTVHSTTLFSTSAMARSRRTPRAARVCHIYTRGDAPTTHQSIAACREHRFCRPLPTASNSNRPRTPSITI